MRLPVLRSFSASAIRVLLAVLGEEYESVSLERFLERIYEGPEVRRLQVALEESPLRCCLR